MAGNRKVAINYSEGYDDLLEIKNGNVYFKRYIL